MKTEWIPSFAYMALLMAAGVIGFAPKASAEYLSTTCTSTGQYCNREVPFTFSSDGLGTQYAIRLQAPASHCSAVRYTLNSSDGRTLGSTDFLSAGETTWVPVGNNLTPGVHRISIVAQGTTGGCNAGRLQSWGVDAAATVVPY
jgi:hypothetical protein